MARAFPLLKCCGLVLVMLAAQASHALDLQGHRGARGLAPENTLAAFQKAMALGVTTLELDIAITADGVPVISHEPALFEGTTRDAQGHWLTARGPLIKTLTLAQLQAYDVGRLNPEHPYGKQFAQQVAVDGQRIPTLASLFKLASELGAKDVQFNIETKVFPNRPDDTLPPDQFLNILLATLRQAGMVQRATLQSFDWRTLQLAHQLEPGLRTVYLTIQRPSMNTVPDDGSWTAGMLPRSYESVPHMVKAAGGTAWSPFFGDLSQSLVEQSHKLGLQVIPWTVNDPTDMQRLLDWGVDGIISDYPDRLRAVAGQRGIVLPRGLDR
jgi:glycerophosphoryl diester phosphodiesterase